METITKETKEKILSALARGYTRQEAADAAGVSISTVGRVKKSHTSRTNAVTKAETTSKAAPKGEPLEVILTVPENGLAVKFQNGTGRIGTVVITKDGLTILRSNAKSSSGRTFISVERAARLFESGVL